MPLGAAQRADFANPGRVYVGCEGRCSLMRKAAGIEFAG